MGIHWCGTAIKPPITIETIRPWNVKEHGDEVGFPRAPSHSHSLAQTLIAPICTCHLVRLHYAAPHPLPRPVRCGHLKQSFGRTHKRRHLQHQCSTIFHGSRWRSFFVCCFPALGGGAPCPSHHPLPSKARLVRTSQKIPLTLEISYRCHLPIGQSMLRPQCELWPAAPRMLRPG